MNNIITIKEFKELDSNNIPTACINGQVIKINQTTEGISDYGKKWKMQLVVIKDETDEMELSLFDKDIGKFTLGKRYEICELGVGTWNGNTAPRVVSSTTTKEIPLSSVDYLKEKELEIEKLQSKLPKISIELEKLSIEESTILYQIRSTVEKNIKQYDISPNQGMIWKMTEIIYAKYEEGKN